MLTQYVKSTYNFEGTLKFKTLIVSLVLVVIIVVVNNRTYIQGDYIKFSHSDSPSDIQQTHDPIHRWKIQNPSSHENVITFRRTRQQRRE